MSTYTIKEVTGPREWQSKYGPMNSFTLTLEGHEGPVELSQKVTTTPPLVGTTVEGDIVPAHDPKFPPKLKKAQQGGFGGGGGGRSDRDWEASGRAQGRAHAQDMALRLAELQIKTGQRKDIDGKSLVPLMDWFYDDAQAAKQDGYRS